MIKIGCHVSAAGGAFNAPANAAELECETFQIFTRPPQGGNSPAIDQDVVQKFRLAMEKSGCKDFVVHCPYFVNFGSDQARIFHGSVSVVRQELERSSLLGAKYVMTHLGTSGKSDRAAAFKQAKKGLVEVLKGYKGSTEFLLEISAGAGQSLGGSFAELADLMEPLVDLPGFGGICFDTQHAFAAGYDLRNKAAVTKTFTEFDKVIGLKYLKMSHINDSKPELGARKDRHEHIGEGNIGKKGFEAFIKFIEKKMKPAKNDFYLILETEHDKVRADIKILKQLRNKGVSKQNK